jgi:hypothetical protein
MGVPWNGLISVTQDVSGGEHEAYYFDGIKYFDHIATQDFQATLTAFTYPEVFSAAEGFKSLANGIYAPFQNRATFGLAYRTQLGNDEKGTRYRGYRLHLIYNCTAAPSSKAFSTLSEQQNPTIFSWTIHSVPGIPWIRSNQPWWWG